MLKAVGAVDLAENCDGGPRKRRERIAILYI
jgi:hypothetical protein